jgi:hypothetical protein
MKCFCCKERMRCTISIDKKIFSTQEPVVEGKNVIRYRKYSCQKCNSSYTTQEICDSKKITAEGKLIYKQRKAKK